MHGSHVCPGMGPRSLGMGQYPGHAVDPSLPPNFYSNRKKKTTDLALAAAQLPGTKLINFRAYKSTGCVDHLVSSSLSRSKCHRARHLAPYWTIYTHKRHSTSAAQQNIHMSVHLSIHMSTHMSVHMSIQMSTHMSVHMSVLMFISMPIPSVQMSILMSTHMSLHSRCANAVAPNFISAQARR